VHSAHGPISTSIKGRSDPSKKKRGRSVVGCHVWGSEAHSINQLQEMTMMVVMISLSHSHAQGSGTTARLVSSLGESAATTAQIAHMLLSPLLSSCLTVSPVHLGVSRPLGVATVCLPATRTLPAASLCWCTAAPGAPFRFSSAGSGWPAGGPAHHTSPSRRSSCSLQQRASEPRSNASCKRCHGAVDSEVRRQAINGVAHERGSWVTSRTYARRRIIRDHAYADRVRPGARVMRACAYRTRINNGTPGTASV
jgi:hypothetical protein